LNRRIRACAKITSYPLIVLAIEMPKGSGVGELSKKSRIAFYFNGLQGDEGIRANISDGSLPGTMG
jgi:hypothetical protein